MRKITLYEMIFKRPIDFIFSLISIIILLPVFLIIGILVRIKLGSPIIFKQARPGKNNKIFNMYKFRTMTNEKDDDGELLPDADRLTKFGKFLRATSLDEIPELFNVLLGQMSIIGPRPQLVKDLWFMNKEIQKRHLVRPGLTGLAQVNGRNAINWNKKFEYDLKYINNITFTGDLAIIFKTIGKVFMQSDVSQENHVTSEDYGDYLVRIGEISKDEFDEIIGNR